MQTFCVFEEKKNLAGNGSCLSYVSYSFCNFVAAVMKFGFTGVEKKCQLLLFEG